MSISITVASVLHKWADHDSLVGENVKRTVKAWLLQWRVSGAPDHWQIHKMKRDALAEQREARMFHLTEYVRVLSCIITYDDGKPKRKARGRT